MCFTLPISEYKVHLHSLIDWADIIHLHWIQDFIDFPTFFANVHKPILWTCHDLNPMMGGFHHIRLRTQYIHQWGKIEQACYDIKNVALKKCKNFLSGTEKHLTFPRGHDRVTAIFQKALTKTVGARNFQRAGGW